MVNPRLPAAFDDVIARGMAKDPDDRFGTAGGLGRAAQRALDGTSSPGSDSGPFATTRQAPPGYPSAGDAEPFRPQGQPGPQGSNRNRPWLVPAAIVMGAALLAGVGVIIGLLVQQNHVTSPTPAPTTGNAAPSPGSYPPQLPTSGESVPPPAPPFTGSPPPAPASLARPPLISGPDTSASHQSCDYGWSLIEASGWGSHAGRGTPETSCFFAGSVLKSYWNQYGNASRQLRRVSAPGAVDCGTVDGAVCDGSNFLIQCAAYGSDNWITCTGGKNARIYLY